MRQVQRAGCGVVVRLSSLADDVAESSLLRHVVFGVIKLGEYLRPVAEVVIDTHIRTITVITEGHVQIQVVDEARAVRLEEVLQQLGADGVETVLRHLIVRKRLPAGAVPVAGGRVEDRQTGDSAEIASQPRVHRERSYCSVRLAKISSLIRRVEKCLVLDDGSAGSGAEFVADEGRLGAVDRIEKISRAEIGASMEFPQAAVQLVRASAGGDIDDGAARASKLRIVITGGHVYFLNHFR